ncbi:MAG: thioredoxin-like domain-containing protein [Thermoguttaceae bacterium]|jgi:thiol-disulfide isomerase/thioredoxin/TolA-binding protein|nr:thioredoxin-like domain-containing protein [Thermoguttaceae bacterium]
MNRFHLAASARATITVALAIALGGLANANPTAEQALRLSPVQKGVDYSRPSPEEAARCKIESQKLDDGTVAWVVSDPNGMTLRMFVDTNGNNSVDQWRYYKDGVEVYRDIDSSFNQKADQFRWFNTGGSRWGIDQNQDGLIDSWKQISPEEVTAEVVAALAQTDTARFQRLVLTDAELKSLGLGSEQTEQLAEKLNGIQKRFQQLAEQESISEKTKWLQFSGTQPGVVPAGTNGSTKDIEVYENVVAVVETAGQHGQVHIGTLVRVGPVWRVIDTPLAATDDAGSLAARGFFFQPAGAQREIRSGGPNEETQELLGQLEKLDREAAAAATEQEQAEYTMRRADLVERIAQSAQTPQDQTMWLRQLADMISAAVQMGHCPDGAQRLEDLYDRLAEAGTDQGILAYIRFRQHTAEYGLALQQPKANFQSIQEKWLENLRQFVSDYPKAGDAAEAMLQLGMAHEFAGEEDEAKEWFGRVVAEFPESPGAAKAAGARRRLDAVGKQIEFRGESPAGGVVDLAKFRGKVMLIQYWATWCEPCKADMSTVKDLIAKYGQHFGVIGVSLDHSVKDLAEYVKENRLTWPQIHEDGGLDSRPANQLGILTVPTMILVDQQGRVVHRNIQAADLERELRRLLTNNAAAQPPARR